MYNSCTSVVPNTGSIKEAMEEENDKETEEESKKRRVNMERSTAVTKKGLQSRQPNFSSGLSSPKGCYSQKQWMNYPTNQTYAYNPSNTH